MTEKCFIEYFSIQVRFYCISSVSGIIAIRANEAAVIQTLSGCDCMLDKNLMVLFAFTNPSILHLYSTSPVSSMKTVHTMSGYSKFSANRSLQTNL